MLSVERKNLKNPSVAVCSLRPSLQPRSFVPERQALAQRTSHQWVRLANRRKHQRKKHKKHSINAHIGKGNLKKVFIVFAHEVCGVSTSPTHTEMRVIMVFV
jgi:hypothetical protein